MYELYVWYNHTTFYKKNMKKKTTCVLGLVIFYETRHKNVTKYFRVLSCFIYSIIENYVYIDYLYFQSKKLSDICVDRKSFFLSLRNSWVQALHIY